jgi:uncharacterized membrane protein YtjA (UPF0391 family)
MEESHDISGHRILHYCFSRSLSGFSGIAGTAVNIAWILAICGVVLAVIFAIIGRRPVV